MNRRSTMELHLCYNHINFNALFYLTIYAYLTLDIRCNFGAGVSLNIHSFIHSCIPYQQGRVTEMAMEKH